jgi:hypothetical protein
MAQAFYTFLNTYETTTNQTVSPKALFDRVQTTLNYQESRQEDSGEFMEALVERLSCSAEKPSITIVTFATAQSMMQSADSETLYGAIRAKKSLLDLLTIIAAHTTILKSAPQTVCIAIPQEITIQKIDPSVYLGAETVLEVPVPGSIQQQYELCGIIMRNTVGQKIAEPEGHYFAVVRYAEKWYRLDEIATYGEQYSIDTVPKDLTMPDEKLREVLDSGKITLKNIWGTGKGISTATMLVYAKTETANDHLRSLERSMNIITQVSKSKQSR